MASFNEWGRWLSECGWNWYFTGTFKSDRGRRITRLGDRLCEWIWRGTGFGCLAFLCGEHGRRTGRYHVHGLISAVPSGRTILDEQWRARYGIAHIRDFRRERGAAYYCGKYALKSAHDTGEYSISGAGPAFAEWADSQCRPYVRWNWGDGQRERARNPSAPVVYEKAFGEKTPEVEKKIEESWKDSWWIDEPRMSGYYRYLEEMNGK